MVLPQYSQIAAQATPSTPKTPRTTATTLEPPASASFLAATPTPPHSSPAPTIASLSTTNAGSPTTDRNSGKSVTFARAQSPATTTTTTTTTTTVSSVFSPQDFSRGKPRTRQCQQQSNISSSSSSSSIASSSTGPGPGAGALASTSSSSTASFSSTNPARNRDGLPPTTPTSLSSFIDSPTLPRSAAKSAPRQPVPPPSPTPRVQQRSRSQRSAARASTDTFGGGHSEGRSEVKRKAIPGHFLDELHSASQTSQPAPHPRLVVSSATPPPSIMFTQLRSSSPSSTPSPSPTSSAPLRHHPSSSTFKEEAQDYWAQKLSQRKDELATGESTTPSALQMALSQSYNATTDGIFSTTPSSPDVSFALWSPSNGGNGFLSRQQQNDTNRQPGGCDPTQASTSRPNSVDEMSGSRDSRDGNSSIGSHEVGKYSDSRPLLSRERVKIADDTLNGSKSGNTLSPPPSRTATTLVQSLPATFNELTAEERQALRRRNTKLVKLLGDEVLELNRERNARGPPPPPRSAPGRTHKHNGAANGGVDAAYLCALWNLEKAPKRPVRPNVKNNRRLSDGIIHAPAVAPAAAPSRPRHVRHQSRPATSKSPEPMWLYDGDGHTGMDSVFEDDPYRERTKQNGLTHRHTASADERKQQQQRQQQQQAREAPSHSFSPLPDNVTPKAAAMLGLDEPRRRTQTHFHQTASQPTTPLPGNITPKAAMMLGIAPPSAGPGSARRSSINGKIPTAGSSSSSRTSHDAAIGNSSASTAGGTSVQSHNTSSSRRSSLEMLLSRVADEVPQALRPGSVNRRPSSDVNSIASPLASADGHRGGAEAPYEDADSSEDEMPSVRPEDEEQEVMYTADEHDSSDGENLWEDGESTPDCISDVSDSSDFISSSMFSKSTVDVVTGDQHDHISNNKRDRQDRRRRADKMSRWLGSVVPAHIIAPDQSNDEPAYMAHEVPGSRGCLHGDKTSSSHSRHGRSSSIDSVGHATVGLGASRGSHQRHSKKTSAGGSGGGGGFGAHLKQLM